MLHASCSGSRGHISRDPLLRVASGCFQQHSYRTFHHCTACFWTALIQNWAGCCFELISLIEMAMWCSEESFTVTTAPLDGIRQILWRLDAHSCHTGHGNCHGMSPLGRPQTRVPRLASCCHLCWRVPGAQAMSRWRGRGVSTPQMSPEGW